MKMNDLYEWEIATTDAGELADWIVEGAAAAAAAEEEPEYSALEIKLAQRVLELEQKLSELKGELK